METTSEGGVAQGEGAIGIAIQAVWPKPQPISWGGCGPWGGGSAQSWGFKGATTGNTIPKFGTGAEATGRVTDDTHPQHVACFFLACLFDVWEEGCSKIY